MGSEMCIRDSWWGERPSLHAHQWRYSRRTFCLYGCRRPIHQAGVPWLPVVARHEARLCAQPALPSLGSWRFQGPPSGTTWSSREGEVTAWNAGYSSPAVAEGSAMRELMRILKSTYRPLYQVLVELFLGSKPPIDLLKHFQIVWILLIQHW